MTASKDSNTSLRGSNAYYQIICRPCRSDLNESAVDHFCDECQEYLCSTCRQRHEQMQLTKDHQISRAKAGKLSLRQRYLSNECLCWENQPVAVICDQHNEAACAICKHRKHRKCKTHCVSIQGDKNKDNKTKAVTNEKLKNAGHFSKLEKGQKRIKSHLLTSSKDKFELNSGPRRYSKRKSIRRTFEKSVTGNHIPDKDMKNNATVFADEPEQNVFGSYNIQTPTGSMIPKQVRFLRSVNIHKGPPAPFDYTGNWVNSICIMPNDCPVLIEFSNDIIKVLDAETFGIKGVAKLSGALADVAVVGENAVITTLCFYKRLQFVQIFPEVLPGKVIQLENECYGVDVFEDEIFVAVTATWWSSGGEIKVLNLNGTIKRSIAISPEVHMLRWPRSLQISKSDGTIYVSDQYTSTILCLTRKGDVLFKYNDEELKGLYGICLDKDTNVYACGNESRNVQFVSKSGQKVATILDLTHIEGLRQPHSIAIRENDGTIFIGGRHTEQLYIFRITEDN